MKFYLVSTKTNGSNILFNFAIHTQHICVTGYVFFVFPQNEFWSCFDGLDRP